MLRSGAATKMATAGKGKGTHVKNTRKKNKNGNGNNSTQEIVSGEEPELESEPDASSPRPCSDTIGGSSRPANVDDEDVCEHEYNREENAKKLKKDFCQSTLQELLAWKKKNASSTKKNLSKAPQNVQDNWKKIKQICDDCPSEKLDVWVDGTYLLLLLLLLFLSLFWLSSSYFCSVLFCSVYRHGCCPD